MRLKVKVNNDRFPQIELVNAETGEPVDFVSRFSIEVEPDSLAVLKLEVLGFDVDALLEAEVPVSLKGRDAECQKEQP